MVEVLQLAGPRRQQWLPHRRKHVFPNQQHAPQSLGQLKTSWRKPRTASRSLTTACEGSPKLIVHNFSEVDKPVALPGKQLTLALPGLQLSLLFSSS